MKISYSNKIYLDKDIVRLSTLSDEAYLAYVAIRFLMTKKEDININIPYNGYFEWPYKNPFICPGYNPIEVWYTTTTDTTYSNN